MPNRTGNNFFSGTFNFLIEYQKYLPLFIIQYSSNGKGFIIIQFSIISIYYLNFGFFSILIQKNNKKQIFNPVMSEFNFTFLLNFKSSGIVLLLIYLFIKLKCKH